MRTRQIICVLCYILSCLFFLYTFGGKTILTDSDTSYELPVFLLIVVFFVSWPSVIVKKKTCSGMSVRKNRN